MRNDYKIELGKKVNKYCSHLDERDKVCEFNLFGHILNIWRIGYKCRFTNRECVVSYHPWWKFWKKGDDIDYERMEMRCPGYDEFIGVPDIELEVVNGGRNSEE